MTVGSFIFLCLLSRFTRVTNARVQLATDSGSVYHVTIHKRTLARASVYERACAAPPVRGLSA